MSTGIKFYMLDKAKMDHFRHYLNASLKHPMANLDSYNSYLGNYKEMCDEILGYLEGKDECTISKNMLRRLYWDSRKLDERKFKIVYLNAFAQFCSKGALNYEQYAQQHFLNKEELLADNKVHFKEYELHESPPSSQLNNLLKAVIPTAIISFLIVHLFQNFTGFGNYGVFHFDKWTPAIFGFCTFLPLTAMLLTHLWTKVNSRAGQVFFAVGSFLFIYFARTAFARKSFLASGRNYEYIFGTPDFESIGIALGMLVSIFMFKNELLSSKGLMWFHPLKIGFAGAFVFLLVYFASLVLFTSGLIVEGDYFISKRVLYYQFPHPERVGFVLIMISLVVYFYSVFSRSNHVQAKIQE